MGEPPMICTTCGHAGKVRVRNRGSALVFVALCLLLLVPGLLYLLYMLTGSVRTCRQCGGRDVLPLDSPRGRELVARYGAP